MSLGIGPRMGRQAYGTYLAVFVAGAACGALLPRAIGPLGRSLSDLARAAGWPGWARSPDGSGADGGGARAALGRIHGLLGEIRGLMESSSERKRGGGAAA